MCCCAYGRSSHGLTYYSKCWQLAWAIVMKVWISVFVRAKSPVFVLGRWNCIKVGRAHCCLAVQVTMKSLFCSFLMRKWSFQIEAGARISLYLESADWIHILDMVSCLRLTKAGLLLCFPRVCQLFVKEHIFEINHIKKRNFLFWLPALGLSVHDWLSLVLGSALNQNVAKGKDPCHIAVRD